MHNLEKLNLSFAEPEMDKDDHQPLISDMAPLAEGFKQGSFSRLQSLDLSYQINGKPGVRWRERVRRARPIFRRPFEKTVSRRTPT